MKIINRDRYLEQLQRVRNTPDIKIITGARRVGKSKLMQLFKEQIRREETKANIIFINLQELENVDLLDYKQLHTYVMDNYKEKVNNYLFIDEIQNCEGFEKAINSLHTKEIFDIYLTGSNAFLLSSDLATLFTGRCYRIDIYPFSFREFLAYFEAVDIDKAFEEYLTIGGFAGCYVYNNLADKYNYLSNEVYQTIAHRDIVQKYNIRYVEAFNNIANFLMNNISNLTSSHGIADYQTKSGLKISHNTVSKFLYYLAHSFVFYKVSRFDLKGKRYLSSDNKYYLVDHALRYAVLGTKDWDYGRVLENIVYIELRRRGYEVYIGKLYKKEIDFVALKHGEQLYIQVSAFIDEPNTMNREVDPLLKIRDAYPKIIIARTHQKMYQYEGIRIYDIARWLNEDYE